MQSAQKIIGLNIKLARIKNGYSQAELADKLSVEQSYISRCRVWEGGGFV